MFSLQNFNFDLLAPECSVTLNFETKWYIVESLPLILLGSIVIVIGFVRGLQRGQQWLLGRLPFGAMSSLNLIDVCVGIFISGSFMMYFGQFRVPAASAGSRVAGCPGAVFVRWSCCIDHG